MRKILVPGLVAATAVFGCAGAALAEAGTAGTAGSAAVASAAGTGPATAAKAGYFHHTAWKYGPMFPAAAA